MLRDECKDEWEDESPAPPRPACCYCGRAALVVLRVPRDKRGAPLCEGCFERLGDLAEAFRFVVSREE